MPSDPSPIAKDDATPTLTPAVEDFATEEHADHGGTPHDTDVNEEPVVQAAAPQRAESRTAPPPPQRFLDYLANLARSVVDPDAPRDIHGQIPLIEHDVVSDSVRIGHTVITREGEALQANLPPGKPFFDNTLAP